jgi:hypothetical protein
VALQLIGGVVQLLYSKHSRRRQADELRRMGASYVMDLAVPKNSVFTGSWADFDRASCGEMVQVGTAVEAFLLLHEYGHVHLGLASNVDANDELSADGWALERVEKMPNRPDLVLAQAAITLIPAMAPGSKAISIQFLSAPGRDPSTVREVGRRSPGSSSNVA